MDWSIVYETLSQKYCHKNRVGGVVQDACPEFKPQYHKKKKEKNLLNQFVSLFLNTATGKLQSLCAMHYVSTT
jgi:hypothetical protein